MDLIKYFSKFGPIEAIKIHRDGGYGFLLYRKRLGAMSLFDAGEIHTVKSFQIECRKVLNRDNLKPQTPIISAIPLQVKQAQALPAQIKPAIALNSGASILQQQLVKETSLLDTTSNSTIKSAGKPLKLKGQYFDPNESSINQNDTTRMRSETNDSISMCGTENVLGSFVTGSTDPYVNEPEYFYRKILDDSHTEEAPPSAKQSPAQVAAPLMHKVDLKKVIKPSTNSWLQKIEAEDFNPLALFSVDNTKPEVSQK